MVKLSIIMLCAAALLSGGCSSGPRESTAAGGKARGRTASLPPTPAARPAKASPQGADSNVLSDVKRRYADETEVIESARKAGVDYLPLVSRCMTRDSLAMDEMFRLTLKLKPGHGAEANADVLYDVLRDVGDRWFGQCLASQQADVQERVRVSIIYDMGIEITAEEVTAVRDLYPKTFPKTWHPEWSTTEESDDESADEDADDDESQDLQPEAPVRKV